MALPPFTENGDLPVGVYRVSLQEILERFGAGSPHRRIIGFRLERIYRVASTTGHLARFVVFGSFITSKPEPNDVDAFMLMADEFNAELLSGEAQALFDHTAAQDQFGASVFWSRRLAVLGDEQQVIEDWQIKRDKTRRGIIEIVEVP